MANGEDELPRPRIDVFERAGDVTARKQAEEVLLKAGALQKAIFNLNTDRQIEGELTKQVLISGKKAQVILTDDLDDMLKDKK